MSSWELPSSTTPSKGTFSPGRTKIVCPTWMSRASTSLLCPFSSRLARSGRTSSRAEMDLREEETALVCRYSPSRYSRNTSTPSGISPMHTAPMPAMAIKKLSPNTSPCRMLFAA